jgi:hypothetical protein
MNTDPEPILSALFPLPEGIKLRARKFGAEPASPLVPAPVGGDKGPSSDPRPEFTLRWEDQQQGLTVLVRERENGHLIADVFCTDAGLLAKAAVSVGLVGTAADHLIRKTIPLNGSEQNSCSGSADFGPLTDVVKELGPRLGIVVFLLVQPGP